MLNKLEAPFFSCSFLISGQGLGARNQGRPDPVRPLLKFDCAGIGHDSAKEFTDHWWDIAFNRVAKRIKVEEDKDTVRKRCLATFAPSTVP